MKTHNFDAELFGAFPVKNQMVKSIERNFLPTIIRISGKILDCIPKGEGLKEWLKEIFFPLPPPIILKNEIEEDIVANVQPFPISSDSPDVHHRIIYVIAHSYDPELNHSISGNFKSPE